MSSTRYQIVDLMRGIAILLMIGYHFTFDLDYYAVIDIDFNNDPWWLGFRSLIVSLFLLLVGISMHLATRLGIDKSRFLRHLLVVSGCAALVSIGSYWLFASSMIFFGILHFIAVASLFGLLFIRFYWANLFLGCGLVVLGMSLQHPIFDYPGLQWAGFMTHKPITEDYVPLLPWFGLVLIGLFIGKQLVNRINSANLRWSSEHPVVRLLAFGGRHSLLIYMLHQPLLIGVLYLFFGQQSPMVGIK